MTTIPLPSNEVQIWHTAMGRPYIWDHKSKTAKWLPACNTEEDSHVGELEDDVCAVSPPPVMSSSRNYSKYIDDDAVEAASKLRERLLPKERGELGQRLEFAVRGKKSLRKRVKGSDWWLSRKVGSFFEIMDLLDWGADPKYNSKDGESDILNLEIYNAGRYEVVELLLEYGATPHGRALCSATGTGHTDNVELLLDWGASINAVDNNGWTALVCAAGHGQVDVVKLLLERGAIVYEGDMSSLARVWWRQWKYNIHEETRYEIGALLGTHYEQQQVELADIFDDKDGGTASGYAVWLRGTVMQLRRHGRRSCTGGEPQESFCTGQVPATSLLHALLELCF